MRKKVLILIALIVLALFAVYGCGKAGEAFKRAKPGEKVLKPVVNITPAEPRCVPGTENFCEAGKVSRYVCRDNVRVLDVIEDCSAQGKVCDDGVCMSEAYACSDMANGAHGVMRGNESLGDRMWNDACSGRNYLMKYDCGSDNYVHMNYTRCPHNCTNNACQ